MLFNKKDLPEIHSLLHRHDDSDEYVEYEDKLIVNSITPYLLNNEIMRGFVYRLQPLIVLLSDQMNVVKNFNNYIVDKYYYKHNG